MGDYRDNYPNPLKLLDERVKELELRLQNESKERGAYQRQTDSTIRELIKDVKEYLTKFECTVKNILEDFSVKYRKPIDGVSPTVDIKKEGKTTIITITDAKGVKTAHINDGDTTSKLARLGEVTLYANKWLGRDNLYSQIVELKGITPNTQVDLTPSMLDLAIFHMKDLAFVTENDNGVLTVYAIGQKPTNDYTIQVTMTEVAE